MERLVKDVIQAGIFFAIIGFIFRYHWARVIVTGFLLAAYGAVVFFIFGLALMSLAKVDLFSAIIQFIFGLFSGALWCIAAKAAYDWVKRHIALDAFWLPWNAK